MTVSSVSLCSQPLLPVSCEFFTVHFLMFFFKDCDMVCDSERFCHMAELKIHAQSYHQLTWFSQIVHTGEKGKMLDTQCFFISMSICVLGIVTLIFTGKKTHSFKSYNLSVINSFLSK